MLPQKPGQLGYEGGKTIDGENQPTSFLNEWGWERERDRTRRSLYERKRKRRENGITSSENSDNSKGKTE